MCGKTEELDLWWLGKKSATLEKAVGGQGGGWLLPYRACFACENWCLGLGEHIVLECLCKCKLFRQRSVKNSKPADQRIWRMQYVEQPIHSSYLRNQFCYREPSPRTSLLVIQSTFWSVSRDFYFCTPINGQIWIVPEDAAFVMGNIGIWTFVWDLRRFAYHTEAVGKALWH